MIFCDCMRFKGFQEASANLRRAFLGETKGASNRGWFAGGKFMSNVPPDLDLIDLARETFKES